jgi:serine/threonine protein kinase
VLYSPPDDQEMTYAFDDWACGVILFAMMTCTLPFVESDLLAKRRLILNIPESISDGNSVSGGLKSDSQYFSFGFISAGAVDIIVSLLNPQPLGRTSIVDVLASAEWLAAERCKELPETATTIALAQQISRPRVDVYFALSLPLSLSLSLSSSFLILLSFAFLFGLSVCV